MNRRALVTGISGQDGYYLSKLLLEQGYAVGGLVARDDPAGAQVDSAVELIHGDLRDLDSLQSAVASFKPDEVYNLAAQSSVAASFKDPVATMDINALGTVRLLEACRLADSRIRFFQCSSNEIFGNAEGMLDEQTPVAPASPYGVSKAMAHHSVGVYRASYAMYACSGILFNHESPRRGTQFVTRKITDAVARISLGRQTEVSLGNLDVWRDWGFAGDYVRAMHAMLQQKEPSDFVIATGQSRSLKEFLELAFAHAGLDWTAHVKTDTDLLRPSDVARTCGNAGRARKILGWEPSVGFEDLVAMMVDTDLELQRNGEATSPVSSVS